MDVKVKDNYSHPDGLLDDDVEIQNHIDMATQINMYVYYPELVGREKVISSHLDSQNRAALYRLQDVDHSVYSEINPLHLPEVLSLIGERHGQGLELQSIQVFVRLKLRKDKQLDINSFNNLRKMVATLIFSHKRCLQIGQVRSLSSHFLMQLQ
jgi:hypothetical protein